MSRVIWRFRLSREDARDIVQDAFALALKKIDLANNPQAWLVRVVDYISMNACRKARRRKQLLFRWGFRSGGLLRGGPETRPRAE
ncbi:MAG: RNA polymerase sigma factor [Thermoanaerobaculia bacterium]